MEMEKDEPLYFLCSPLKYEDQMSSSPSMFWYVIEDDRNCINEHGPEEESIIDVVVVSETDQIRLLPLPPPPSFLPNPMYRTDIAVFNSYLYLLGGRDSDFGTHNIVRFTNICKEEGWRIGPPLPSITPQTIVNMATSNNGSIVIQAKDGHPRPSDVFSKKRLLYLSSLTSCWEILPEPSNINLDYSTAHILAITNTHLFCTMYSTFKQSTYGVFFHFSERKWCVFDRGSFHGNWSQGVVFYNSYLVCYGTSTPRSLKKRPSLHVYDLKACKWLPPHPSTHPSKYKNVFPSDYTRSARFFKVGPQKLAVVWSRRIIDSSTSLPTWSEVYCTKFIIHKTYTTNQPQVYTEVFSHGTYRFCGEIISSVARSNVGELDQMTLEKSKNEALKLVAEGSWLSFIL